jgi:hypothetical protein
MNKQLYDHTPLNENIIKIIVTYTKFIPKLYIKELKYKTKKLKTILDENRYVSKYCSYGFCNIEIIILNPLFPNNLRHLVEFTEMICPLLNMSNIELLTFHPTSIIYRYVYGLN